MTSTVRLSEILSKNTDEEILEDSKFYDQVTVRLWGKGVCKRNTVQGINIKSKKRFVIRKDQFIISRIDARHGAYGLVPRELDKAVVTTDFPTYNLDTTRIIPQYFQWVFSQRNSLSNANVQVQERLTELDLKNQNSWISKLHCHRLHSNKELWSSLTGIAPKLQCLKSIT